MQAADNLSMRALVYRSQQKHRFSQRELNELVAHAAAKNQRLGVTGYLCYRQGLFLQYLEGPAEALEDLMHVISQDPRHEVEMTVWIDEALDDRRFPDWSMRNLTLEGQDIELEDVILQSLRLFDPRLEITGDRNRSRELLTHQLSMLCRRVGQVA